MFITVPSFSNLELQSAALILNTITLIIILITSEIAYSEASKTQRARLRLVYPFICICVGLVFFALFQEMKG